MRTVDRVVVLVLAASVAAGCWLLAGPSATARADSSTTSPFAICDVMGVVEKLMDSERFKPARDEAQAAAEAALAPIRDQLRDLEARGRGMDPADPELPGVAQQFQQLQAQFQQQFQESARRMDEMTAMQLQEAYEIARASADAVAEDLGYGYVFATRLPDEEIEARDVAGMVRALLGRPVVRFPKDSDITPDVLQDLKIS